jgi:hypothetical protein
MQAEQSKGESNPSATSIKVFEISGGSNLYYSSNMAALKGKKPVFRNILIPIP